MTNGLIIGASHCAALRLAWTAWRDDWPGMSLDFAALQGGVEGLMVDKGQLLPRDDAARARLQITSRRDRFALCDYAFIAVCGGVSGSFSGMRLYNQARWYGLPSVSGPNPVPSAQPLLSTACFAAALTGIIRGNAALPLLTSIRDAVDLPLFAISEPLLSFSALADTTRFHGFRALHRNGDADAMAAMLETASTAAYADLALYIAPPAAVRKDAYFTHPDLRRGATRLGAADQVPQPEDDFLHGNAEYGRQILTALHQRL